MAKRTIRKARSTSSRWPSQSSKEAPQGNQLPALGDQDDISDAELSAGDEQALLASRTVDEDAVFALEVSNAPTAHGPYDAGVRA